MPTRDSGGFGSNEELVSTSSESMITQSIIISAQLKSVFSTGLVFVPYSATFFVVLVRNHRMMDERKHLG